MKKLLSSLLILTLVIGMSPNMAFAEEQLSSGEELRALGLLRGDENGNLNEENEMTRAEMMVVLARMHGKEEVAENYYIDNDYTDVMSHWARGYILYAVDQRWTKGIGGGLFDPSGSLTMAQASTFHLRILGYSEEEGDFNFDYAIAKALEVGILSKAVPPKDSILRGELFDMMKKSLDLEVKGESITLRRKLELANGHPIIINGIKIDEVSVKSHIAIEVTLKDEVEAVDKSQFTIIKSDGVKLVVESANLIDSKHVWVITEEQTAGKLYSMTSGDGPFEFTGISKDRLLPEILKGESNVKDNITVAINFNKDMDKVNAINPDNYSANNGLEILDAEFGIDSDDEVDYSEVILTTSSQTAGRLYEIVAEKGVTDMAGNRVNTEDDYNSFLFGGLYKDTTAPKISTVNGINARKIVVYFSENSDLTEETAEDIDNYEIKNLSDKNEIIFVESAELVREGEIYRKVNIRTSLQSTGDIYELKVSNVMDKFGNVISSSRKSFVGQPEDRNGPEVETATSLSNTKVEIIFNEILDKSTAENHTLYRINNDLTVISAELVEDDNGELTKVELATTSQEDSTVYKVTVSGVEDEYGNRVGSKDDAYFAGRALLDGNPKLETVIARVEDNRTYVYVTFNRDMDLDTTKIASNYYFGSDIGYGISVEQYNNSIQTFKVRVNELDDTTRYKLEISGVTDSSGNIIDSDYDTKTFVGVSVEDTEDPEIIGAVTMDNRTVKIIFNRSMRGNTDVISRTTALGGLADVAVANNPLNYVIVDKNTGASVVAIKPTHATLEKGQKRVVLTLDSDLESGHTYDLYAKADDPFNEDYVDNIATDPLSEELSNPLYGLFDGLLSENGIELDEDDARTLLGGTSIDTETLDVETAFATSRETLYVKFNKKIKIVSGAASNIQIKESGSTSVFTTGQTMAVDPNDETVLLIRTNNELDSGDKYSAYFSVSGIVNEKYSEAPINAGVESSDFYATSQSVMEPSVASVEIIDDGVMRIIFTKDMHEDVVSMAAYSNYRIEGGAVNFAEFDGDSRNAIIIYFDPFDLGLQAGRVYTLEMTKNYVIDILGFYPDENQEIDFAIGSESDIEAAEILEVRIVDAATGTYSILFDKAVKFSGTDPSVFELYDGATLLTSAVEVTKAYSEGLSIDMTDFNETYVDSVEFVKLELSPSSTHTIALGSGITAMIKEGVYVTGAAPISGRYSVFYKTFTGSDEVLPVADNGVLAQATDGIPTNVVLTINFNENVTYGNDGVGAPLTKTTFEDIFTGALAGTSVDLTSVGSLTLVWTLTTPATADFTFTIPANALKDRSGNFIAEQSISIDGDFESPGVTALDVTTGDVVADAIRTITFTESISDTSASAVESALSAVIFLDDGTTPAVLDTDYHYSWDTDKKVLTITNDATPSTKFVFTSSIALNITDVKGNTSVALEIFK